MALRIAIAGAGIGGLTAALALGQQGLAVTLAERRTGFDPIGAGIQLSPNASRVLLRLGLGPALKRLSCEPERVAIRSARTGADIGEVALGTSMRERFGAPYLVIHRADLQTILLDAVRSLPNVRLLMGRAVTGLEQGGEGVVLSLDRENGAEERLSADLVVGADGIRSAIRSALGDRRKPTNCGFCAWRATVPRRAVPRDLAGPETGLWLGPAGHVVHYPIAGGRLVNIVAVQRSDAPVEGWSARGDPAILEQQFSASAPALRELLRLPERWDVWSLFDLSAKRLARGRLVLLGDAGHPVLPFLAQGGALAIEDAATLAAALESFPDDPIRAAKHYAAARTRRVRQVQRAARRTGRTFHLPPPLSALRDLVIRRLGPEGMRERQSWLYAWMPPTS